MTNRQQSIIRIVAIRQPFALFDPRPWRPPMNIYETARGLLLVTELAGIAQDDLQVHIHPSTVQIQGIRQVVPPAGLRRIQRLEIASGPFQVEVPLTTQIDPERVEARYANGLLNIWLPFANKTSQRVVVIRPEEGGA